MASGKVDVVDATDIPVMLIAQRTLHNHPPCGLVPRIQVSVQYKIYTITVLMRVWKKEPFESFDELDAVCKMVGNGTKYKFCPGIEMSRYMSEYHDHIRFHIKSVRLSDFPFYQVDSQRCDLYFELAHNATRAEKGSSEVLCYPCKRLVDDLKHQKRRTAAETPARKQKRQMPSSKAKLSYTSRSQTEKIGPI